LVPDTEPGAVALGAFVSWRKIPLRDASRVVLARYFFFVGGAVFFLRVAIFPRDYGGEITLNIFLSFRCPFFYYIIFQFAAPIYLPHIASMPTILAQLLALSSISAGSARSNGGKQTTSLFAFCALAQPLSALSGRHIKTHIITFFIRGFPFDFFFYRFLFFRRFSGLVSVAVYRDDNNAYRCNYAQLRPICAKQTYQCRHL
jgi:hypothetical protein